MAEKTHRAEQQRLGLQSGAAGGGKSEYKPFVPGPNPDLPAFIKQHATPYDPKTDKYDVKAFDRDLVVDKAAPPKAIYDMHTYWSKKHWASIREYIRHYLPNKYYPEGTGLVLDCFSGSGMTGVAAMMENRPCVLIDASPAAAFISHCYTHPVDPDQLQAAYDRMMTELYPDDLKKKLQAATGEDIQNLQQELDWLYATKCDRCGGDATTEYVVYSERFQCPRCGEVVALFDCPEAKVLYLVGGRTASQTELKKRRVCPYCLAKRGEPHREFVVSTRTRKFGSVPVLVRYRCQGNCRPTADERRHDEPGRTRKARFFHEHDLGKVQAIDRAQIPHWYPDRDMIAGWETRHKRRLDLQGILKVSDLFTHRNLWALGAWMAALRRASEAVRAIEALQLAFTGVCMGLSRMNRYRPNVTFPLNILIGTYYIPQIFCDAALDPHLRNKVVKIEKSHSALRDALPEGVPVLVSGGCAEDGGSRDRQIDYIFTDPAYVDKVQYGELNFVWESWLGFDGAWLKDEIVVNPFRGKTVADWDRDLRAVLARLYAALKPGRWMSLCYHDTDPGTWARLQNMLLDAGFEIHTVTVLDPKQKSSNQLTAEKVVKSDLVLNCRKPRPGEREEEGREVGQVSGRVRDILIETLSAIRGQTRDKLWDILLKRLLTRGQMAEHRFDDLLGEVATRSESGRWFLKEEFEGLSENDLRNEEDAGRALERFGRLRCMGVPVALATQLALSGGVADDADEDAVERHIRREVLGGKAGAEFRLAGRMKGCEFYDCLFLYLTRYLKGRPVGRTPRRNLAEFLEEYLVRFRDGDKWLYRPPTDTEAASLKKSRQSGLGRRIRQFVAYLNGEGDFPKERIPDAKTLVAWLKHCANFGLAEAGVALFERGGLTGQLSQLGEDERYDAEDYYAQCRRNAGKREEEATDDADDDE
jgi:DNA modification methylase